MSHFCCPVCRQPLTETTHTLQCPSGHSFDKAKSGYVNLLCSQRSHLKRHGDDKRMLSARRCFLDSGFYAMLQKTLCETVRDAVPQNGILLDTGCGEGYYTVKIAEDCPDMSVCGIDISKDALQMAANRSKSIELAVASVFSLPVSDSTVDAVINVFAPCADAEFRRILKPNGVLVRVIPTERHLFGLKAAIYKEPRLNKPERIDIDGFTLVKRQELSDSLILNTPDDIRHLFEMTPYYYKTGQNDQQRLLSQTHLETEIAFAILTYQKQQRSDCL